MALIGGWIGEGLIDAKFFQLVKIVVGAFCGSLGSFTSWTELLASETLS